jgi:phosphate transport system protein
MPLQFDADLGKLKEKLLQMGAIAETMIHDISAVLIDQNTALLARIYENEKDLDRLQIELDEEMIKLISVYTPVAGDLRLLLMVTRINAEIERIGDKIVDIGHIVENYLQDKRAQKIVNFTHIAEDTQDMLRKALNAFVNQSHCEALAVINADDRVDQQTDQTFRVLFTHMLDNPQMIGHILGQMLAAQALERIADHAENIAEDVIYIIKGEDVRHLGKVEESNSDEPNS